MTVGRKAGASVDMSPIKEFLGSSTPQAWSQAAADPRNLAVLLVDHANCEKKAASTAVNLIYRYVDKPRLLQKMSKLAREELRHFEQVVAILEARNIDYIQLTASRYAGGLRAQVRAHEPARLVDTMIAGAFIEARSCERFASVIPLLDNELSVFYNSLLKSESRHFNEYLGLARRYAGDEDVAARIEVFRETEQALIAEPDTEFRFHSGPPG